LQNIYKAIKKTHTNSLLDVKFKSKPCHRRHQAAKKPLFSLTPNKWTLGHANRLKRENLEVARAPVDPITVPIRGGAQRKNNMPKPRRHKNKRAMRLRFDLKPEKL
jgi:hypothetical protein